LPNLSSESRSAVPNSGQQERNPLVRPLVLYLLIVVAFAAIEWGYAGINAHVLHSVYPRTSPLFDPLDRYSDWTNFLPRAAHTGEPGMQTRIDLGLPYPYPLPSIYLFVLFLRLFADPTRAYIVFTVAAFALATIFFSAYLRNIKASGLTQAVVWITLLLGSPAAFLLDRGNIEVFLWLFVLSGLVCFVRDWKYLAAIFFAIAACMKIYPALYFLLFIPRRQFKALALGVVATAVFSLLALAAVGPTIPAALRDMSGSAKYLRDAQITAVAEGDLRFDHSLLGEYKQLDFTILAARHLASPGHEPHFNRSVSAYSILAPLLFVFIYLGRLRRMPLLNQFAVLTILSVLLPYVSYEYTLVHIYLVLGVFLVFLNQDVRSGRTKVEPRRAKQILVSFAILTAPISFLALEHFQGQIKCLALCSLMALFLFNEMPSSVFADSSRAASLTD